MAGKIGMPKLERWKLLEARVRDLDCGYNYFSMVMVRPSTGFLAGSAAGGFGELVCGRVSR
jgi:hypothetical protein